jgi:hypothetical protein
MERLTDRQIREILKYWTDRRKSSPATKTENDVIKLCRDFLATRAMINDDVIPLLRKLEIMSRHRSDGSCRAIGYVLRKLDGAL